MLELQLLPARQGDAIWIRWTDGPRTRQLLVDMGTTGVGKKLRDRLNALPADQREFDLLVVTHIDADHIGGVLACLVENPETPVVIHDVWFNGLDHLVPPRPRTLEDQGGVQGKQLMDWLGARKWNAAFEGGRVCADDNRSVSFGELKLTVLGPTQQRLAALAPRWAKDLVEAMKKKDDRVSTGRLEAQGRAKPKAPELPDVAALDALAALARGGDKSEPNGSSIALLVEHPDARILLAGDAFASDLVTALSARNAPIALDAVKLPHHGSKENVTKELLEVIDCPLYLFSTDGTQFFHPDAAAVASVIAHGKRTRPDVELGFNCTSDYSGWWNNEDWKSRFGYRTQYGDADGLTIRFPREEANA